MASVKTHISPIDTLGLVYLGTTQFSNKDCSRLLGSQHDICKKILEIGLKGYAVQQDDVLHMLLASFPDKNNCICIFMPSAKIAS